MTTECILTLANHTLISFAAAVTGMPVMLRDDHIRAETPADIDDENITKTGYLPALPNESTRMSGTLALLGASRILGKAVEMLYPSAANNEISIARLHDLSEELDTWKKGLPTHLQLVFAQDKPSTNVTGSRSPLLVSLFYYTCLTSEWRTNLSLVSGVLLYSNFNSSPCSLLWRS